MPRFICLLALLPVLASAQPKAARTCRILFLGAPDGAPEKLHLFDGEKSQPVELPQMNLSPVYQLPAGALVLRMLPAPPADPKAVSPEAPKAALGEAVTDFFILVSSDPSNNITPVKMRIIDVSGSKLPRGHMLWFNLTPNTVGGQVGSRKLVSQPNSRTVLGAPASATEDYQVNLNFRMPGNEHLYPLCETKRLHDPSSRTLFFIVAQNGSRTPRILGFPDQRDEEEGKKAKP